MDNATQTYPTTETRETQMQIAQTILDQIGHRALMMIGASGKVALEHGVQFKVGRNARGVTHVVVNLDPIDTYTVTYSARRGASYRVVAHEDGIYFDMLRASIERNTGLYTSL